MVIRLWHNRTSRAVPRDDETGEPLYAYPLEITPGNQLIEVHRIENWPDEAMPQTPREVGFILYKACDALDVERLSLQVGDAIQIGNRFWACEALDAVKYIRRWSGLQPMIRMLMSWTKKEHSAKAPCGCPECLQLVLGG